MPGKGNSLKKLKRVFKIHQLLRKRDRSFSAEELVYELKEVDSKVNERTVRMDIATIRDWGAKISGHKHKGYSYQKPFSLLNELEAVNTGEANEILAFFRQYVSNEAPIRDLDRVLIQIEQGLRGSHFEENPFIQYEQVELKNIEKLDKFYRFIEQGKTLDIKYRYFGSEEIVLKTIRPLVLKEYNNRWTLVAYDKEKNELQNFPLDRIEEERISFDQLSGDNTFNAKEYFKNVIGSSVMKNQVQEITFSIKKKRAYYVESKKWHNSQVKKGEDENSMTFGIQIIPNNEYWAKVMEYVEDIEILSPAEIRQDFLRRIEAIYSRFILE